MRKLIPLFLMVWLVIPFHSVVAAPQPVSVYYEGADGGVKTALDLCDTCSLTSDMAAADVLVLNGSLKDSAAVQQRLQAGAGLVMILSDGVRAEDLSAVLGQPVTLSAGPDEQAASLAVTAGDDPVQTGINWSSAPQVRERVILQGGSFTTLVESFEDKTGLLLAHTDLPVYVFTPALGDENHQFQEWAYFNYLIHHLAVRAGGGEPASFADYPGSPVPHNAERLSLGLLLLGVLILAISAYILVRRYSRAHPEALDRLVIDPSKFKLREIGTDWEEIGFHRPLGGFFMALFFGILLFVPLIIYQNLILPVYILPSAQALGIWGRVTQFFNLIWLFFDMGTSVAFIKFFSQYRVKDPRRGVLYGQVFVWWQAISGAVQVALLLMLAGTFAPRTAYAIYTWSVIIHTAIQLPGFYQVMRHSLTALQRFDYAQILDLGLALIFPMLTQPVFVTIMVAWGNTHPVFGPSMGGVIGMGLAAYAAEALTFVIGLWLFRRLGYNAKVFFMAHFDWSTIKESFRFGVFDMLGSAAWGAGQALEILITQARLVNYAEIWGNWMLAQNFVYAYNVLATLYNNLMPSISEAISHGRRVLSQFYSAMAYKWGGLISAMLLAELLAVADRFILGASGPEFVRAAAYATPLLIWGAVQYPSWVGDNVQRGANRPWLIFTMVGLEQVIRVALAWVLLPTLQINALIIAYIVGIMIKNVVAYLLNHRLCYPQRFYVWQSLIAPLLAGAVHYGVLRLISGWLWQGDQVSSILIFFIAILPSYPLYAFFYGLFGGWDNDTLEDTRKAVGLSGFTRPMAWLFWRCTALGARFSPLHGRFPISLYPAAMQEANDLETERVSLLQGEQGA